MIDGHHYAVHFDSSFKDLLFALNIFGVLGMLLKPFGLLKPIAS